MITLTSTSLQPCAEQKQLDEPPRMEALRFHGKCSSMSERFAVNIGSNFKTICIHMLAKDQSTSCQLYFRTFTFRRKFSVNVMQRLGILQRWGDRSWIFLMHSNFREFLYLMSTRGSEASDLQAVWRGNSYCQSSNSQASGRRTLPWGLPFLQKHMQESRIVDVVIPVNVLLSQPSGKS